VADDALSISEVPPVLMLVYIMLVRVNDLFNICGVGVFTEAEPLDEGGDSLLKFSLAEDVFTLAI
jgi:hypothetical protein